MKKLLNDIAHSVDIFRINLTDISDAEGFCVGHLARIDGVTTFLDVLIHFLECIVFVGRVEKCRDDRTLMFIAHVGFKTEGTETAGQETVVFCIAFVSRRDTAFFLHLF